MFRKDLCVVALTVAACAACSGCENNLPKTRIDEEAVTFFDQESLNRFEGRWDSTIVDTVFESTRDGGEYEFLATESHLKFKFEHENGPISATGAVYLLRVQDKKYAYVKGELIPHEGSKHPFEIFGRYKFSDGEMAYHAVAKAAIFGLLADQKESREVQLSELLHAMHASHNRQFSHPHAYVRLKRRE